MWVGLERPVERLVAGEGNAARQADQGVGRTVRDRQLGDAARIDNPAG
jgi:hypothetical protein